MGQRHFRARDEAVALLIDTARRFHANGWMLGTSGNLSIATGPTSFVITASGNHKGSLGPGDFVDIDIESGRPIADDAPKPSAETAIHSELYRRTGAGAVYHVHQVAAAVCSTLDESHGEVRIERVEMLKGIGLRSTDTAAIPIVENDVDIPYLARTIGELVADGLDAPGVLIKRHGIYTWGQTADDALRHIEIFDYLFEYRYRLAAVDAVRFS